MQTTQLAAGSLTVGKTYTFSGYVRTTGMTFTGKSIYLQVSDSNGTHWNFTWEHGRRLATASNGTNNISYTYDADGLRTSKTVDGVTYSYYYAGGKLLRLTYGDNVLDFFYDASGNPYVMRQGYASSSNYTDYYYITNLQGDVIRLVDIYGNTAAYYEYDAFGNVLEASGSHANVNPLRYRGYVYDTDTGLYYLQSRYYDPQTGRFINADVYASTGQGILGNNMFGYCHNNPIMYVDPSGYIIVLATDATEDQVEEYERAISYLKRSKTAKALIEKLDASPTVFVIVFVDDDNMYFDPNNNTICFDTDSGLVLGDGTSVQSAALGLAHEMGHAAQKTDGVLRNKSVREIEASNLQTYETPIAQELGEPARSNYFDTSGVMRMQNSTHYRTTYRRPWWHYIGFWNWGKPSKVAVDHNVTN